MTEAARAVLCDGSTCRWRSIQRPAGRRRRLGEVPDGAPAVPLQRDLARLQRALRLKPEALERELELDLRKETDAGAQPAAAPAAAARRRLGRAGRGAAGSTGTFRETWRLRWEPELSVRVAEAGVWGTTVLGAATAKARGEAAVAAARRSPRSPRWPSAACSPTCRTRCRW